MDLKTLATMFPKTRRNMSPVGVIPMEYFAAHEAEIREAAKAYYSDRGYRIFYRGPRRGVIGYPATSTLRQDAVGAVVYPK